MDEEVTVIPGEKPPEKDEAVEGKEQEKDEARPMGGDDEKEPAKQKRVACKKVSCEKCGRSYSIRRIDDHKCVPPTFHEDPPGDRPPAIEKPPLPPPPGDRPPVVSETREPTIDDLTPDVISELIRREREMKRAAKRERWTKQLF